MALRTLDKILSMNLKKLRKASGLTQNALAEKADIPFRTYQAMEYGDSWPELANLKAVAKALGEPESRLFQDPDLKPTPEEALEIIKNALESPRAVMGHDQGQLMHIAEPPLNETEVAACLALLEGMRSPMAGAGSAAGERSQNPKKSSNQNK